MSLKRASLLASALLLALTRWAGAQETSKTPTPPPVLAQIDRIVRQEFWDPQLKGVDWASAVSAAGQALERVAAPADRDAVYDRLLARLEDSHTFRVPPGRLPPHDWGTAGLRIGPDGAGFSVKGVIPDSSADRAGLKIGDRILNVDGRDYGKERVNFRDQFLIFEGAVGTTVRVRFSSAAGVQRTAALTRTLEEPGDALVWKSARVIRRDGRVWGYARIWGLSAQTALALVDLLLDREEASRAKPELTGWDKIEGLLLDIRGNSGGYDPNILGTFLRGQWSSGDYYILTREGRRLVPPPYRPLPVALLINSGTASAGEALALQFRQHAIGPIVGEPTAGMASGGASAESLSDGSTLWISRRAIQDTAGKSYEGRGISPDVSVTDRPAAEKGAEDAVIEAGIRALSAAVRH